TKLRMHSSSFRDPLLLKFSDALAKPYDHRMSPLGQERFVVVAAAGLISNLADLEKLLLAETKHDGLITKSLTAELHKAPPEGVYGMGHITTRYGEKIAYMGHTGLGMGWNSSFQFIPNSGSGIIVLTNGDNGFYIHNTLTCAWYYSRTKRSDKSCKVAPDKKLNLFEYVLEASYEKGLIEKTEFDKSKAELKAGRNDLNSGKFEESIERISVLRKELKAAIKDAELLGILDQAFDSYSYWIGMPWMKQTRTK
ncbi:MAG: serine hydrolase, partial [Acidobacteriota bacterium]|nr:serine hydrolase [Acidobacteriota bacterium]